MRCCGFRIAVFLTVHTEGGSLAEYLEVAAGPQQQKRPLPRAPCVAVGKMQGGIKVECAQEVIRSNLKLAPRSPQQLFAGSSAVVFYSLLTSAQKYCPHLPAAVTSDLVTGSAPTAPSCLCGPHSPCCLCTQMLFSLNYILSFLLQIKYLSD